MAWEREEGARLPFPKLLSTEGGLDFAGRVTELEALTVAWKQTAAGDRRSVLVAGEPGVGKTRLAGELARSVHEAGGAVIYGRCQEDLNVPYEPFVEALTFFCEHTPPADLRSRLGRYSGELVRLQPDIADLVPGLDPQLRSDPETEQYRLFQAVTSWLAAAGEASGLLFVVDDLHWAPPPTLRLLAHVLGTTTVARFLLVGTFRDTEVGQDRPSRLSLPICGALPAPERIDLGGLTIEELTEVLGPDTTPTLAATPPRGNEGQPLLRWGNPPPRRRVRTRPRLPSGPRGGPRGHRLPGLPPRPEDRRRSGRSRGPGRDVELVPLATVAVHREEATLDALDEALAARLVEETGAGTYRFVHALVRSALDGTLSATRKARLHLRAAEVFEEDPAKRAHHLVACAPLGGAIPTARACLAAGNRALAVLADAEAGNWYSQGLAYVDRRPRARARRGGHGLRIDLLAGLGEAQRRTGDGASRQTLLDAARLAADDGDVPRLVRAVVANNRGWSSNIGKVDEERLEIIAAALDLVGAKPSAERAELLSLQATELIFTGDHRRVLQAADEAGLIADRLDDPAVRARVSARRVFACQVPERAATVAVEATRLVGLADTTGDPQLRVLARRPTARLVVGALDEAHRRMTEAMAIADESGQPGLRSRAHFDYAGALDALGDHAEAERLTQVAFDLGQQAAWPDAIQFYGGRMAMHWVFEGQPEIVTGMAAQAVEQSPRLVVWRAAWALGLALSGPEDELTGFLAELSP